VQAFKIYEKIGLLNRPFLSPMKGFTTLKRSHILIWALVFQFCLISRPSQAELYEDPEDRDTSIKPYFYPPNEDMTPRRYLLPPLLSFVLPGADQWIEGQYKPAGLYSFGGLAGIILLSQAKSTTQDNRYRDFAWQSYFLAGGLSLYHSFRTAVTTRIPNGEFKFLGSITEKPSDLMMAPIDISYLQRWTTLVPLILAVGAFFYITPTRSDERSVASLDDFFYSGSVGYMTGVGEEAVFRGYLLPVLYQYTESQKISLGVSSGIFALCHGLKVNHFVTAFFFGLYSGWLTQQNNWSLGEVTFIHTWWDVLAFVADYTNHRKHAFLKLPTISINF
jgi:membrane protease YdiL (CAAX protease family)